MDFFEYRQLSEARLTDAIYKKELRANKENEEQTANDLDEMGYSFNDIKKMIMKHNPDVSKVVQTRKGIAVDY